MALRDVVNNAVDSAFEILDSLLDTGTYHSIVQQTYDPVLDSYTVNETSFSIKFAKQREQIREKTTTSPKGPAGNTEDFRILVDAKYFELNSVVPKMQDNITIDSKRYVVLQIEELPITAAYSFRLELVS